MADFAFNWTNYNPQTGGEDARIAALRAKAQAGMQGYNNPATLAQQQMQGFVPNVPQQALAPVQQTSAETYRGSYESDMAELSQLEGLLRTIDSQIAELENSDPRDTERKLASLGASIGDMSLYNAMVAREGEQSRKASGASANINNILAPAWEVVGQLTKGQLTEADKDTLTRKMTVAMQKAEEEADKLGYDISQNRYYRELSAALSGGTAPVASSDISIGGFSVKNDVDARNKVMDLYNEKKLRDSHIAELDKWRKEHPNDEMSTKIGDIADEFRGKTMEARGRYEAKEQRAWNLYNELSDLSYDAYADRMSKLKKEDRKLLETFHPDILKRTR